MGLIGIQSSISKFQSAGKEAPHTDIYTNTGHAQVRTQGHICVQSSESLELAGTCGVCAHPIPASLAR
jgi:hypothetical protein